MKYLPTFFALLVLGLAAPTFLQAAPPAAPAKTPPRAPKILPPAIKAEVEAAIANIPKDNGKALAKITARLSKKYSDFAPEIVADVISIVATALAGQPDVAAVVIPQIVGAAAHAVPSLSGPIVAAAIGVLPAGMKHNLVAAITEAAIASVAEKSQKADALNAAFQAIGDDPEIVKALDAVAESNHISILPGDTNEDSSIRYYIDDTLDAAYLSGDQGVGTVGSAPGFGGAASSGNGNQTSPTPTPAPTPTPFPPIP